MSYIKTAIGRNRVLNHLDLIQKKETLINSSTLDQVFMCQAGHIELQLTDKCILNCPNCHFRDLGDNNFSFDWLDNIIKYIKPKAITLAGGGEPTIYPYFDKTIKKLKEIPNVQIGLITNGVIIPKGSWSNHLNWVRISVYSIENGKYAGRNSNLSNIVLENIDWYVQQSNISNIGLHFLFYKNNILDIIPFTKLIYNKYKKDNSSFKKIHIQFKPAFIMAWPSKITPKLHKENIKLIPNYNEINTVWQNFNNEVNSDSKFLHFLKNKSNYQLFKHLLNGYLDEFINLTNGDIPPQNKEKCRICLAYQLITPDGLIYPCCTLAEYRKKKLSLCHITDLPKYYNKKLKNFYLAKTECCNEKFCRSWDQNKIIENQFIKKTNNNLPNDYFF